MIEQWTPISLLIFVSVLVILVYGVGLWAGTVLKDQIEKDFGETLKKMMLLFEVISWSMGA